jgi:hypothetical protein
MVWLALIVGLWLVTLLLAVSLGRAAAAADRAEIGSPSSLALLHEEPPRQWPEDEGSEPVAASPLG